MIRARIDEPSGPATEPIRPHGCNQHPTAARKGRTDLDRQMTPESDRQVTPVTCRGKKHPYATDRQTTRAAFRVNFRSHEY
ncbi:hypothetical protein QQF64_024464 [Cirrhinus molitorella]|uniref:Uncharacterized protein n=1 Tax=Cirrhinus molitorella TaxID=172907 RepID=A0ABR3NM90_9TELE